MLRQIEWWVQDGPITKNGVLPATTLLFWKVCFSLRTSNKELIWCTNNPNAHIPTFCKRWSFILRCFFPVSILKRQPHKMVKHIQTIRRQLLTNCSSVFDHFVGLQLKVLNSNQREVWSITNFGQRFLENWRISESGVSMFENKDG